MFSYSRKTEGFTMLELILVITIFSIIFTTASYALGNFHRNHSLKSYVHLLLQDAREARTNSVARLQDSQWGIYLKDNGAIHSYTFFKGSTYASRDTTYDRIIEFPESIHFSAVNFSGQKYFSFAGGSGDCTRPGYAEIVSDDGEAYLININSRGLVEYEF